MNIPAQLKTALLLLVLVLNGNLSVGQSAQQKKEKQPNIMLIVADDLTFRAIEPYGNSQVHTPNLAKLAQQGMCMDNMYTATAMCAPTRQQLYTGLFPVRNGAYPNHSEVYPGTKSVAHHLQALGYNTALIGKKHYGSDKSFPFQFLGGRNHDDGKGMGIDLSLAEKFIQSSKDKPYMLVVASNQPHAPLNRGNAAAYPPQKIKVPEDLVDTDQTRKQLSLYFAEVTYLDSLVGVCMEMVERSGQKDNTIIMFTSEHGAGFPFAKWTTYDSGLKTAFIASWPGHIQPGSRSKAMAQYVDVVPTLVDLAGGDPASVNTGRKDAYGHTGFDGSSFKKVLLGQADELRQYVFGVHTTRGIIKGSEAYPIRSARSNKYLYVSNLNPDEKFSNVVTGGKLLNSWTHTGKPADAERAIKYVSRPAEELYDVEQDPYQLVNLAGNPAYDKVKQELKTQLTDFMKQQGDKGMETEMKAYERQPKKGDWEDEEEVSRPTRKGKKKGAQAKKKIESK